VPEQIVSENPVDLDHLIGVAVCPICPIEPESLSVGANWRTGAGTNYLEHPFEIANLLMVAVAVVETS
jgi:hypothetical protein